MKKQKIKFCSKCGAQLKEGARFCGKCGASVAGDASAVTEQKQGKLLDLKTHNKKKSILILLLIFLILLVIAVLVWGFSSHGEKILGKQEEQNEVVRDDDNKDTEWSGKGGDQEETYTTETVVEETESAGEVLPDYESEYKEILESYTLEWNEQFAIAYIDEDDIPELLIFQGNSHADGVEIYTIVNGEAVYVDCLGAYGTLYFYEKQNLIWTQDGHMDVGYDTFYRIVDGTALQINDQTWSMEYSDDGMTATFIYYIDNVEVSEEEYNQKIADINQNREPDCITYEDAYPFESVYIDKLFPDEDMTEEAVGVALEAEPAIDIDVEKDVEQIRTWYYDTQNNISDYWVENYSDATAYNNGEIEKIVCEVGDYTHEYYYHDGKFYFAFIFKGTEEYRYYFKQGILIRYIDSSGMELDYGNLSGIEKNADEVQLHAENIYQTVTS